MTTKKDVEYFLEQFKIKLDVYDIVFRMRTNDKNERTLFSLDITPFYRKELIRSLEVRDYSRGPLVDELYNGTEMWVFGKDVKGQEVYIKISMGKPGKRTICISFHIAEYPMHYPFKE
ncbi:MAG: toxin [Bacteroides sp.]|nr:hypothetical protein [Ruminococcus flavefaciens]MCM1555371.1 toxin [Bacteroides sp.]